MLRRPDQVFTGARPVLKHGWSLIQFFNISCVDACNYCMGLRPHCSQQLTSKFFKKTWGTSKIFVNYFFWPGVALTVSVFLIQRNKNQNFRKGKCSNFFSQLVQRINSIYSTKRGKKRLKKQSMSNVETASLRGETSLFPVSCGQMIEKILRLSHLLFPLLLSFFAPFVTQTLWWNCHLTRRKHSCLLSHVSRWQQWEREWLWRQVQRWVFTVFTHRTEVLRFAAFSHIYFNSSCAMACHGFWFNNLSWIRWRPQKFRFSLLCTLTTHLSHLNPEMNSYDLKWICCLCLPVVFEDFFSDC